MSEPARKAGKGNKRIGSQIANQAVAVLTNPEVQRWILEHSEPVLEAARKLPATIRQRTRDAGGRFGQRGLERRHANLNDAIGALSRDSPSLAEALSPVSRALGEVDQMLKVSAALPLTKRKKAHWRIDRVLDALESALFDAASDRHLNSDP